jgi:hypothetical protein
MKMPNVQTNNKLEY